MAFTRKRIDVGFSLAQGQFEGGGNSATITGHRVTCLIDQAGAPSMASAAIAIFGLPLSLMNQLTVLPTDLRATGQNFVTISAYEEGSKPSLVFKGTITSAFVDARSQPDVAFRVEALAGLYQAVAPAQATSVQGSADVAQTMQQIAQRAGLQFEGNGVNVKLSNPYYWGSAYQQLRLMAEEAGVQFTIDRDVAAIWPSRKTRQGGGAQISPQTGMVGYPAFTSSGIDVVTTFNPQVQYGGLITVQSDLTPACGQWSVIHVVHELETEIPKGRWFSIISASRLAT